MAEESTAPGASHPFEPGRVLGGKFRVERELGVGGMGVVLAATHLELDELVALKVMLPRFASNLEAAARFAREARASVKIRSQHMVRVLDVARLEDGTPYIVMEHLEGRDLARVLAEDGPLSVGTAVGYVLEACDAIAAAHVLGIIHRDLKPANLFLARDSEGTLGIKVLDFGISKLSGRLSDHEVSLTSTYATMGSPLYMAPEQMRSAKNVDARTDIWALGCVLYELLTGSRPFRAETMPELCAAIMAEPPAAPSRMHPGIAVSLDRVVLRCLQKAPTERYESIAELAQALEPFSPESAPVVAGILRRATSGGVARIEPTPSNAAEPVRTDVSWSQTQGEGSRKSRLRRVVLAALAVVLGAAGIWGWRLAQRPSAEGPPIAPAANVTQAAPTRSASASSPQAPTPVVRAVEEPERRAPPAPKIGPLTDPTRRLLDEKTLLRRPSRPRPAPKAKPTEPPPPLPSAAAKAAVPPVPKPRPVPDVAPAAEPTPAPGPAKARRTLDIGIK